MVGPIFQLVPGFLDNIVIKYMIIDILKKNRK